MSVALPTGYPDEAWNFSEILVDTDSAENNKRMKTEFIVDSNTLAKINNNKRDYLILRGNFIADFTPGLLTLVDSENPSNVILVFLHSIKYAYANKIETRKFVNLKSEQKDLRISELVTVLEFKKV